MAFVHIGIEEQAKLFFSRYGLDDLPRLSNPGSEWYRFFGLEQAGVGQVLSLSTFQSGLRAMKKGFRQGKTQGNSRVMPGLFLIKNGKIIRQFVHESPGDKPDFMEFIGAYE
ncbi:MAG: hypothetical protein ACKVQS_13880 [Fimbriimonadaceae bacterium]